MLDEVACLFDLRHGERVEDLLTIPAPQNHAR